MAVNYQLQKNTSGLYGGNAAYIETLYESFLEDPTSVSAHWQSYFASIAEQNPENSSVETGRLAIQQRFEALAQLPAIAQGDSAELVKQLGVLRLIEDFRYRAHRAADIDPIALRDKAPLPSDNLAQYGLSSQDLSTRFDTLGAFGTTALTLGELIDKLKHTYAAHLGLEIEQLWSQEERQFFIDAFERHAGTFHYSNARKQQLLESLIAADGMEKYLHKRFVGQKRFSLEGGDALIPLTHAAIDKLAANGAEEIGIAMAHRGRLNMLINVFGKTPQSLFDEFEGKLQPVQNRAGDVKYHMGFSATLTTDSGKNVDISLAYNPSHLEFVNAVQLGSTRARLERRRIAQGANTAISACYTQAVPILIHGDAALAGQGINQELLQLSQLRHYQVGGALHIVVNNQIGFTTSHLDDARSSLYCTDIAKAVQVPVIHFNGDDPEAAVFAAELAADYIQRFHKDIFIDLVCYRRLGHNEADEPAATQPKMYEKIRKHPTPAQVYAKRLEQDGIISAGDYDTAFEAYRQKMEAGAKLARAGAIAENDPLHQAWQRLEHVDWQAPTDTRVARERLQTLGKAAFSLPADFEAHKIVGKLYDTRLEAVLNDQPLDWGTAENLAYASLLDSGYLVRISGEDCGRGTFSHRHAAVHDQHSGQTYYPLQHLHAEQAPFRVIDSLLSETGVLGFEYGYATAEPNGLIIWEAQFGDFANVAQVIIDQFIASGETKWGRYNGLTMLLPHGYEGQGPEHSSARLERYLQLCAENNMQVCVPTTPAQIFHLLRRQVLRHFRKPLIVMTPKSLLRHKLAVSALDELANGRFEEVIDAHEITDKAAVQRVVLCSGKVYYDLLEKRRELGLENIALVRIEQLYPFPEVAVREVLASYPNAQIVWCQEEPRNQGAWTQILERLMQAANRPVTYIGRRESASTAAGYAKVHAQEQQLLVEQALTL